MNKEPFIKHDQRIPEFTLRAVILGTILAVVLGAANVYLGLYAGMTVASSIPAAVVSMAILRGVLKRGTILENNIVQTVASAGTSVASGIIFTIPALVFVGAWTDFKFWPTAIMGICGVLLGVIFMIPLRKVLIVEEKELSYPEGVACGEVLIAGEEGGSQFKPIFMGVIVGGIFKFLGSALNMLKGTVEWATGLGGRAIYVGSDVSMALLGIGYIINLDVSFLVFLGGFLGWSVAIPLLGTPVGMENASMLDISWELWSSQVRYIGVGCMLVGGVWSIISMRKGIFKGVSHISSSLKVNKDVQVKRTERDMGIISILISFAITLVGMFFLYRYITNHSSLGLIATVIMAICAFAFVAVSSYITGLVGSSNNPVSGMIICALIFTSIVLLLLGYRDHSAIISTLGIAGVVCVAASIGGDTSQDLKTGYIVGGTPKYQQIGLIIGGVVSALFIPLVLVLLHKAYVIGVGLKAPQANLFANIAKAIFGEGTMPMNMVVIGIILAIVCILVDELYLAKKGSKFRIYIMPIAVGIYLPVTLAVPILIGGFIRYLVNKKTFMEESKDPGILFSSGLIAGESLMGIVVALFIFLKMDLSLASYLSEQVITTLSVLAILVSSVLLWRSSVKNRI
jgi:putative OPT family oligopeptide transporter